MKETTDVWVPPTDKERKMFMDVASRQRSYVGGKRSCPCHWGDEPENECKIYDLLGGYNNYEFRARIAESLAMDGL